MKGELVMNDNTKNSDDDGSTESSSYPVGKTAAGISGGSPDVNTGKRGGRSRAWKADR